MRKQRGLFFGLPRQECVSLGPQHAEPRLRPMSKTPEPTQAASKAEIGTALPPAASASEAEMLAKAVQAIDYVSNPEICQHGEGLGIGAFAGVLLAFAVWKSFRYGRTTPRNRP